MKKILLILFVFFFFKYSNAQPTFSKVYYENNFDTYGYSIAPAPGNGFLICGNKFNDGLIYKIDSAGTIAWDKKYSVGLQVEFNMINPTADSGFILIGHTTS